MCRAYSPAARLEIEREQWRQEHGTEMPKPEPRSDFVVIAPVQLELPFDEDRADR
jgi:hypothetical protein